MLNRILIASFIALFVITVFEVSFLILPSLFKAKTSTSTASPINNSQNDLKRQQYPAAVYGGALGFLANFRKADVRSAILRIQYTGKITKLYSEPGTSPRGFSYVEGFRLKGAGDYFTDLYLNENDFSKTQVIQGGANNDTKNGFDTLKLEDNVLIDEVIDLAKNTNQDVLEIKIRRIK